MKIFDLENGIIGRKKCEVIMPHISIKCYSGRTEEQKRILAEQITKDVMEVMSLV